MGLTKVEGIGLIQRAQDRVQLRALMNTVMNLSLHKSREAS
jgi:hypothetical protein